MDDSARDRSVPPEIATLLGGQRVVLRETKRAVTPFAGVVVFVSYMRKIDLLGTARQHMRCVGARPTASIRRRLGRPF
jgi:hypothetical protein